ncbi:MAG: FG-GAP-like repeat-containing protein [Elusimicrobiales bacterium]
MTSTNGLQILHQDTEPRTLRLEYQDGGQWKLLSEAVLSSGAAAFQFSLPQQKPGASYQLKAVFSGDENYSGSEATATLTSYYTPPLPAQELIDPKTHPYFKFETKFGSYGSLPGQFMAPVDATVDNDGSIYVLDARGHRLQKFSSAHAFISSWTLPISQWETSYGVNFCVDGYGGLYASSESNLFKYTTDGALVYTLNSYSVGAGFWVITDIACGPNGEIYVPSASGDVFHFDLTGRYLGKFSAKSGYGLGGIATDSDGNIYLSDFYEHAIRKFSPDGSLLLRWGTNGSGPLQFATPWRMEMDSFDNLYVNDTQNKRISVFTSSGNFVASFGGPSLPEFPGIQGSQGIGLETATGKVFVPDTVGQIDVFSLDISSPSPPTIVSPVDNSSAYSARPKFMGKGKPGNKVEILEYTNLVATATCDSNGWFLVESQRALSNGPHRFSAREIDYKGYASVDSVPLNLTIRPFSQPRFNPPLNLGAGFTVYGVASADFNGDGKNDVVALGSSGYKAFLNNGNGGFSTLSTVSPGFSIEKGFAGDFDKDGAQDIAVLQGGYGYAYVFSVLWGNNNGTFVPSLPETLMNGMLRDFAAGDIDNDGNIDFVFAGSGVILLKGGSGRTFQSPQLISGTWSTNIGIEDFNNDGKSDLYANSKLYFGDGAGIFGETSPGFTCDQLVAAPDLNGDSKADLIAETSGTQVKKAYLSEGDGKFLFADSFAADVVNSAYAGLDANGDAKSDLAAVVFTPGVIRIFPGKGDGGFGASVDLNSGVQTVVQKLAASDINGDGLTDIAAAPYGNNLKVFYNSTASPDLISPSDITDLAVAQRNTGETVLSWTAPGGNGSSGQATLYDVRAASSPILSTNAFLFATVVSSAPAPQISGSSETFVFSGIGGGATYYFAVKSIDASGNSSGLSNSPEVFINYAAESSTKIGAVPEVIFLSPVPGSITQVSTVSSVGTVVIGSAAAQSLTMASNLYEIGPERAYTPPALLTFSYSTSAVAAAGLVEADIAVYEHFVSSGWVRLDGQVIDTLNHKIIVPINRIASLFGIFGVVKDKTPPDTTFAVTGSSWPMDQNGLYVGEASSITLTGNDPVAFGTATGVAFTEFRVDASSSSPFVRYLDPFRLSTGAHRVEFRSADNAGNIEEIDARDIFVDVVSPDIAYALAGATFTANGTIYAAGASTVALISSDEGSGVGGLSYEANGSTFSEASGRAQLLLSTGGAYSIAYSAVDNVGNVSKSQALLIFVDTAAPVSAALLDGSAVREGW